jgi:hypothetical protein
VRVKFTNHFLIRCRQQNINPIEIREIMLRLARFDGIICWRFEEGFEVVCMHAGERLTLITIIGIEKKKKALRKVRDRSRKFQE